MASTRANNMLKMKSKYLKQRPIDSLETAEMKTRARNFLVHKEKSKSRRPLISTVRQELSKLQEELDIQENWDMLNVKDRVFNITKGYYNVYCIPIFSSGKKMIFIEEDFEDEYPFITKAFANWQSFFPKIGVETPAKRKLSF